ncbi:9183_t:CDS:1, partial [Entrophospora sp. SA101]
DELEVKEKLSTSSLLGFGDEKVIEKYPSLINFSNTSAPASKIFVAIKAIKRKGRNINNAAIEESVQKGILFILMDKTPNKSPDL